MRRIKVRTVMVMLFVIAIIFSVCIILKMIRFSQLNQVGVFHADVEIEGALASRILNDYEEDNYTFFREDKQTIVQNKAWGRETKTCLLTVCDNASLLFPTMNLYGLINYNECIIGAQTAYELFGSESVIGQRILINNSEYSVVSVVENRDLCVIKGTNEDRYTYVIIQDSDEWIRDKTMRSLANTYGIVTEKIPYNLYNNILKALLVPGIIMLIVSFEMIHNDYKKMRKKRRIIATLLLIIYLIYVLLPGQYELPDRISDIHAWEDHVSKVCEQAKRLQSQEEIYLQSYYRECVFW